MGNPIYASDLYVDDKALDKAIDSLMRLGDAHEKQMRRIAKNAKGLADSSDKLSATTAQGRDELKKSAAQADKLAKAYEQLEEAQSENGKKLIELREERRKANQLSKLEVKLNNSLEGSYDNLSAQYSILKIKLNTMGEATKEARNEKRLMEVEAKGLYEQMKDLQEATGKHTLSVGDYGKALRDLGGPIGGVIDGLDGVSEAFKILLRNPLVLVLATIVGGLVALTKAFKQSEQGAEFMAKASGVLSAVWGNVIELADKLFTQLVRVFTEPREALEDFGEAVKESLIDRFTGFLDLLGSVKNAVISFFKADLKGLKEAAGEAGTALVQMGTGFTAEEQRDFADAVRETTKEIINEANAFAQLEAAKLRVRRANREIVKGVEDLITKEELLRAVEEDTTKSFAERNKAAEEARKILEERASKEIQLAKNNLSILNQEISLRRANREEVEGLLDQQLGAYRELRAAERDLLVAQVNNARTLSELKQDELERDLDILIDGFDNQKTINERRLKDERLTFEERVELLRKTQELSDGSFAKQIETIQRFTDIQVDANSLIAESDAVVLNEKIRGLGLSEIIEGRLLEVIRDRRTATQDLAEAEVELAEAQRKAAEEALKLQAEAARMRREEATEGLRQQQELERSAFDLLKSTEAEKTKFVLEQEIARYNELIRINEEMGGDLSEIQVETLKNRVLRAQQELSKLSGAGKGFFESLGFSFSEEQKKALGDSFSFAKGQVGEWMKVKQEAAERGVEQADREVESAERSLSAEIEKARAGRAANISAAEDALRLAEENQRKAERIQERAARREQVLAAIQQGTNLISASAKIWAQLGFPAALPALGIMWGSFAAAKVRAFQATKIFRDGGLEFLTGGSHASGNDVPLYTGRDGVQRRAEGGEAMLITNKSATNKYRGILPILEESLNKGYFERVFSGGQVGGNIVSASINTKMMEERLEKLVKQGERTRYEVTADGKMLEMFDNVVREYI